MDCFSPVDQDHKRSVKKMTIDSPGWSPGTSRTEIESGTFREQSASTRIQIGAPEVADLRGTDAEHQAIRRHRETVTERLLPLAHRR